MDQLTTPLTLRSGLTLANRLALAPLTNTQSHPDGTLGEDELRWLVARAAGGFGLVETCAAYVSEEGHAWVGQLGVASDEHLPGLTRLATALRDAGGASLVQLHHAGAKADQCPGRPLSADDGGPRGPRAATEADLARVVADFAAAAARVARAGFDGVEIHGANGYVITQFLAPGTNHRGDRWGGDLVGRARLAREIARAVRAAVPAGFTVGIRLSPVDLYDRQGLILADSVQVARWLAEDGVDFVHLSLRDAAGEAPHEPGTGPVVRAFRDALPPDVSVIAVGGVWTAADALRARSAGADVVAAGKVAIGNPDWARRVLEPGYQPVRPTWSRDHLARAAVGPSFYEYLTKFPGLVEGGRPAR